MMRIAHTSIATPLQVSRRPGQLPAPLFAGTVTDKVKLAQKKLQEEKEQEALARANSALDIAFFKVGETAITGREVLKLIDEMGKACECKLGKALSTEDTHYYPWDVRDKLTPLVEAGFIKQGTRVVPQNGYLFHHSLKLTERGKEVAYAPPSFSAPAEEHDKPVAVALDLTDSPTTNYPED